MSREFESQLNRFQATSVIVGILGLGLCGVGALGNAPQFFASYLFGYLFWLELSLGCLVVAMIYYLTGGRWGNVTGRFLEAGFMNLPLMGILFLPILFGLAKLYPWAQPAIVADDKALQSKAAYLNETGFVLRFVIYFAIWTTMAFFLRKWSLEQDATSDVTPTRRMRALSGPGVVIYTLTVTFAFIDWVMSLEPDWYSTMFAIIMCAGQILIAYTFSILLLVWFRAHAPMAQVSTTAQLHQLGNLLLAFVIFWTYVVFGQFLINWSGNTPREIIWYQHRVAGSWKWIIAVIVLFHFFLPFFVLLFRSTKRRFRPLTILATIIFAAHVVTVYWMVMPAFHPHGLEVSWMDVASFFGVGGIWLFVFTAVLRRRELLARNDPRIEYAIPA